MINDGIPLDDTASSVSFSGNPGSTPTDDGSLEIVFDGGDTVKELDHLSGNTCGQKKKNCKAKWVHCRIED